MSAIACGSGKPLRHYVAYDRDQPVGACTVPVSQFGAKLETMAFSPPVPGREFDAALMNRVLDDAERSGVQFCYVDSADAAFYARFGFSIIDRSASSGSPHARAQPSCPADEQAAVLGQHPTPAQKSPSRVGGLGL
ncbi:GNAT family N-acetyltransferase [Rhodococcus jostii]|uniref:GNAT family N-acetyltransferase n=1 Tax=Rhodococcus jostii TaxID=132919 RepID=UPI003633FD02